MSKVKRLILSLIIGVVSAIIIAFLVVMIFFGKEESGIRTLYMIVGTVFLIIATVPITSSVMVYIESKKAWNKKTTDDYCCVCNKKIEYSTKKSKLSDGYICNECLNYVGIRFLPNSELLKADDVRKYISHAKKLKSCFTTSKELASNFSADEEHKIINVNKEYIDFSQIVDYEILEDGETITKGGISGAVAGGILFGGAGALIGATAGNRKTKSTCNSLKLHLTVKDYISNFIDVDFLIGTILKSSQQYKTLEEQIHNCVSFLKIITESKVSATNNVSNADEILKYKQLLDCGAITEDEYNSKKSELLH